MRTRFHAFFNPIASLIPVLCIALATSLQSMGASAPVRGIGRHFVRSVNADNSGATDTLEWYCDESILYELFPRTRSGGHIAIPTNATASWIVLDPATSNTYICANASTVTPSTVSFFLPAGSAALPRDITFESYVLLLEGTNLLGVADHAYARCLWSPLASTAEVTPTNALLPIIEAAIAVVGEHYASTDYVAEYVADHLPDTSDYATKDFVYAYFAENLPDFSDMATEEFVTDCFQEWSQDAVDFLVRLARATSNSLHDAVAATSNAIPAYAYNPGGYAYPDYVGQVTVAPSSRRYAGTSSYDVAGTSTVCNVKFEKRIGRSANTYQARAVVVRAADPASTLRWGIRNTSSGGLRYSATIDDSGWICPEYNGSDFIFPCGIRASIGSCTSEVQTNLTFGYNTTATNNVFVGPTPGSLLEDAWGLYVNALTNTAGRGQIWQYDPNYTHPTAQVYASDFWAGGATNFAWMSVGRSTNAAHLSRAMPAHLITPRHVVMAQHYGPPVGSTNYWIGEDGICFQRKLVARSHVVDDVAVGLLDTPIPETSIRPVAVLRSTDAGYFYGDTNGVSGKQGWPVLAFDIDETAWFMWAQLNPYVNSSTNRTSFFFDLDKAIEDRWLFWGMTMPVCGTNNSAIARSRPNAIPGDSGAAVCLYSTGLNGGRPVLLGLYHYATGIPQLACLDGSEKSLQTAIDAIGNPDYYAITYADFSGWTNPDIPPPPVSPSSPAAEPEP